MCYIQLSSNIIYKRTFSSDAGSRRILVLERQIIAILSKCLQDYFVQNLGIFSDSIVTKSLLSLFRNVISSYLVHPGSAIVRQMKTILYRETERRFLVPFLNGPFLKFLSKPNESILHQCTIWRPTHPKILDKASAEL